MSAVTVQDIAPPGVREEFRRFLVADLRFAAGRPGVRTALVVWVLQIMVFAYLIPFVMYRTMKNTLQPDVAANMWAVLQTSAVGPYTLASAPLYGLPVGVAVGALVVTGDYRNQTMPILVGRLERRWVLVASRFVVAVVVAFALAVASIVTGMVMAWLIGLFGGGNGSDWDPGSLLAGLMASWLSLGSYAVVGAALGFLTRNLMTSTLLALGWVVGVEQLGIGMLSGAIGFFAALRRGLLSTNTGSLAGALDRDGALAAQGSLGPNTVNSAGTAVVVLLLWMVVALVVSLVSFRQRDLQ